MAAKPCNTGGGAAGAEQHVQGQGDDDGAGLAIRGACGEDTGDLENGLIDTQHIGERQFGPPVGAEVAAAAPLPHHRPYGRGGGGGVADPRD